MSSLFDRLMKKQLLTAPPSFMKNNVQYEVIMGSVAYGVSSDNSDIDVYGFCIPPKDYIFPYLKGEIEGFGQKSKRFEQFQQHHIFDKSENKEYDIAIYNIVKYFQLCMNNNPNMIDSLFVPLRCILHSTAVGNHIREKRKLFLHKGSWHKFKGYAYSQLHKASNKKPDPGGKRYVLVQKYGFDVKFAYHIVRLLNEVEQILVEHDLDLQRNREQLKSIRRGEWTLDQIREYFETKEKQLEELYVTSDLQYSPNEEQIKTILLECLEMHYGSLDSFIKKTNKDELNIMLDEINTLTEKIRRGI